MPFWGLSEQAGVPQGVIIVNAEHRFGRVCVAFLPFQTSFVFLTPFLPFSGVYFTLCLSLTFKEVTLFKGTLCLTAGHRLSFLK